MKAGSSLSRLLLNTGALDITRKLTGTAYDLEPDIAAEGLHPLPDAVTFCN
jgi:hypothetical protein